VEYETAVKHMTRRKLEEYAVAAAETLERLENENSQLRRDIQLAQVVDMDVIKGWQRWSQIADEEREKWADTATRLTGENEHLKGFMDLVERASGGILVALTDIGTMASEESEEGTNQKAMRKGLKKITQLAKEARQAYDEYLPRGCRSQRRARSRSQTKTHSFPTAKRSKRKIIRTSK